MELVNTIIKIDNRFEREEERIYHSPDNLGFKNYWEIKNKFFNKPLDMVIIDEINDLRCKSHITLHFKIRNGDNEENLFTNIIKINDMEEADYSLYREKIKDEELVESLVSGFINFYGNNFFFEMVMNIVYYKLIPLDDYHLD